MDCASIRTISECYIKPNYVFHDEPKKPNFHLGAFDLFQLCQCYLQTCLLFDKLPSKPDGGMDSFLKRLKHSLSSVLAHFYPLAGQFVTEVDKGKHNSFIFIDSNKGQGAKFIHAGLDNVTVNDIVSPTYVPTIVQSLFALGRIPTNYDAHDEAMLIVQVTELVDGISLGISVNHAVVDGTSFWHFLSSWSEIFQSNDSMISRLPIFERGFPEGYGPIIKFPCIHPDEFMTPYKMDINDTIKELILHFSSDSIATLKEKAEADCGLTNKISSVQALSALLWRVVARSRCLRSNEYSTCFLIGNYRSRLNPPLSQDNFGTFVHPIIKPVKVGELLENNLGWVAKQVHQAVEEFTGEYVHDEFVKWVKSPIFYKAGTLDPNTIMIGGLPRIDVNDIEFGLGKTVAIRTGSNKYEGRVFLRPGINEKGNINVEICLSHATMTAFQHDTELLSFLS